MSNVTCSTILLKLFAVSHRLYSNSILAKSSCAQGYNYSLLNVVLKGVWTNVEVSKKSTPLLRHSDISRGEVLRQVLYFVEPDLCTEIIIS